MVLSLLGKSPRDTLSLIAREQWEFIIRVDNYNEPIFIQVFDLSGKIQFEGYTQNNQLLNLNTIIIIEGQEAEINIQY